MRALLLALSFLIASVAGAAHGRDFPLAAINCAGDAQTQAAALALEPSALDCGSGRFSRHAPVVRLHADLRRTFLPKGILYWQTEPSTFDTILLLLTWEDGQVSWIDVDPGMAARNWAAQSLFSVPLPTRADGVRLIALDTVIEGARTLAPMRDARLVTAREAAQEHFSQSMVAALVIGMLLVPIAFTVYFYRLLQARFMLWHAAMAASMALFVLVHSGLVFDLTPKMPLVVRWQLNSGLFLVSIICAVFFTLGLLEKGKLSLRWRRALLYSLLPVVVAKLAVVIDLPALRPWAGRSFSFSFLPMMIALPGALIHALRRGSRAALFGLFGFGAMTLAGLAILADIGGLLRMERSANTILLASLVIMSLATSAGVGDRFMVLRMKLDRARHRAARLGRMAFTDGLTGLANRRAFDSHGVLAHGTALLVADLDFFKRINDRAGHAAGDAALCRFAWVLRQAMSGAPEAQLFRLGGEEFAIIVPCSDRDTLAETCERIRRATAMDRNPEVVDPMPLTVSIGATIGRGQSIADAFLEADRALYGAKKGGRDRCHIAGDPEPDQALERDVWEAARSRI